MSSWLIVIPALVSATFLALSLFVARKLADRHALDQFSLGRYVAFWVVTLALAVLASLPRSPWLFGGAALLLGFWLVLSLAFEMRGSARQRQLATVQFHVVSCALQYLFLRSRGMLDATSAARSFAFAIDSWFSELIVPWASRLVSQSAPGWAQPASIVGDVAFLFSSHLLVLVTSATLVLATFAAAYLSERPLPAPGASALPWPSVVSGAFGLLVLGAWLTPAGSVSTGLSLGAAVLAPYYVAESLVLLHRWSRPLRTRGALLLLLVLLAIWVPAFGGLLVLLGWLGQLFRLRELLPFAALVEMPLGRPRLIGMLGAAFGLVIALGLSAVLSASMLRRASPKLGSAPELCGSVKSSVSWKTRTVSFATSEGNFAMDLDESALPVGASDSVALERECEARGKRLCTSDEWYVACLCTYPRDAQAGTKLSANYFTAARADQERKSPPPAADASTLSSDKLTEVRSLITKSSEVVSGAPGRGVLVAGPGEGQADAWTDDCRYRALVSPRAMATSGRAIAGLRCCR